jgi:hypothetical protein
MRSPLLVCFLEYTSEVELQLRIPPLLACFFWNTWCQVNYPDLHHWNYASIVSSSNTRQFRIALMKPAQKVYPRTCVSMCCWECWQMQLFTLTWSWSSDQINDHHAHHKLGYPCLLAPRWQRVILPGLLPALRAHREAHSLNVRVHDEIWSVTL